MANQTIAVRMEQPSTTYRALTGWRAEWRDNRMAYGLLLPSVIAFTLFLVFPIVNMFIAAFSTVDTLGRTVDFGTLANFKTLINDARMPQIIRQTESSVLAPWH
ncbi:MAG: hypothetical protein R2932_53375 [Caldilineaceae bacterium]